MDIMRNIGIPSIDWNKEKFNPKNLNLIKKLAKGFKPTNEKFRYTAQT